tara:strand:- start:1709 stop:1930 length:222 start_codon:yes stop_codon:yes gene_type:complete
MSKFKNVYIDKKASHIKLITENNIEIRCSILPLLDYIFEQSENININPIINRGKKWGYPRLSHHETYKFIKGA